MNQIDGGPEEERLISALAEVEGSKHVSAPPSYWRRWREECETADMILVNSAWARDCLVAANVARHKLAIVPLMYRAEAPAERRYPARFDADHPLVALFLGAFSLRKGARTVLDAAGLGGLAQAGWARAADQLNLDGLLALWHPPAE